MGRALKAWKRKSNGWWYAEVDGRQVRLSKAKREAEAMVSKIKKQRLLGERPLGGSTVAEVLDTYLEWCKNNRAENTFIWYQGFVQSFVSYHKSVVTLPAEQLEPHYVTSWVDSQKWRNSTKRGAMIVLQRAYNWAERQRLIGRSPIGTLEKPQAGRRETPAKEEDLEKLLAGCRSQEHRDLLIMSFETGARPQEIKMLTMEHYSEKLDAFVIPACEAKGKKRARIIHLTERAREIVERLKGHGGTLLRNKDGKPWTAGAVNCLMRRLAGRTGIRRAQYDLRHGRATQLLEAGVDHLTVSAVLGHVDSSTLARVYSHISKNNEHIKAALRK